MDQDKRPTRSRLAGATDGEDASPPPSFNLSLGQVLASSLAAASAAAVASVFGVAGTVIGTALFSVVATVATTDYQHAGQRTVRHLAGIAGPLFERPRADRWWDLKALPWRRILPGAALVFVIAFAVMLGKPGGTLVPPEFHTRAGPPGRARSCAVLGKPGGTLVPPDFPPGFIAPAYGNPSRRAARPARPALKPLIQASPTTARSG
jgi:hypothetical protein